LPPLHLFLSPNKVGTGSAGTFGSGSKACSRGLGGEEKEREKRGREERKRKNLMDSLDSPCVEQNPLSQGRFPRINMGRDPNVPQSFEAFLPGRDENNRDGWKVSSFG